MTTTQELYAAVPRNHAMNVARTENEGFERALTVWARWCKRRIDRGITSPERLTGDKAYVCLSHLISAHDSSYELPSDLEVEVGPTLNTGTTDSITFLFELYASRGTTLPGLATTIEALYTVEWDVLEL